MKKVFTVILIGFVFFACICLASCDDASEPYIPEIKNTEEQTGLPLEYVYNLEDLEISPWDFVVTYEADKVEENVYYYTVEDSYELIITLGESWKDTSIYFNDTVRNSHTYLCKNDLNSVDMILGSRKIKNHDVSYEIKSADGSAYVLITIPYNVSYSSMRGDYVSEDVDRNWAIFVNGVTEMLPEAEEKITDTSYSYEYYQIPFTVLWHPSENIFIMYNTKSVYEKIEKTFHKYEGTKELYDYIYFYNCDTGEDEMIVSDDFRYHFGEDAEYIYCGAYTWSPCGRYAVLGATLTRNGDYEVFFYDTETKELIYGGDIDIQLFGYAGSYSHLAPPEMNWDNAYAVIEANRGMK